MRWQIQHAIFILQMFLQFETIFYCLFSETYFLGLENPASIDFGFYESFLIKGRFRIYSFTECFIEILFEVEYIFCGLVEYLINLVYFVFTLLVYFLSL